MELQPKAVDLRGCHKEQSLPPEAKQRQLAQRWVAWVLRGTSHFGLRLGSKVGKKSHPGKQTINCKADCELDIERRHANFLVKTYLQVKNFLRQSTQEATPDGSEPEQALHPRQTALPLSGQTESAGSDDYWLWGDQPGSPTDGPACKPCCPHTSLSQSPWSLGSNLPSRGTQTPSQSPEARGLYDKKVNSSPRVYRRCSQCPKFKWSPVSLCCLNRPYTPGGQGREEVHPVFFEMLLSLWGQIKADYIIFPWLLILKLTFLSSEHFSVYSPKITRYVIWHTFTFYTYPNPWIQVCHL